MSLNTALTLLAHPDDETVLVGGTLAMLAAHGVAVHVVCATRGEGGEAGEPPVVTDRRDLGQAREAELRCAAERLGAASVDFLGYIDPEIGPENQLGPFQADFETLVSQLMDHVQRAQADLVLVHGPDGEYGHPAHQLMHRAAMTAIERLSDPPLVYSIMATVPGIDDHIWNESRLAHFALDITPWAEQKIAAMLCHVSQHALFLRRRKLAAVHDALRSLESFYREAPSVDGDHPDDAFARLLVEAGTNSITHPMKE